MSIHPLVNDELKKTVGQRIKLARGKKNISQEKLAEMLGVKKAAISHIESGKNFPSIENLIEISKKLEVNTGWILQGSVVMGTTIRNISDEGIDLLLKLPPLKEINIEKPSDNDLYTDRPNIYYVPNPAQAGIYRGVFDYQHYNLPKVWIPNFENVGEAFLFHVEGESMYPFLSNGDMVVAVKINSVEEIKPGFAYVICTREMLVVKRIQRIDDPSKIILVSDNSEVQDAYPQPIDDITNIFLVKGAITANTSKRVIFGR